MELSSFSILFKTSSFSSSISIKSNWFMYCDCIFWEISSHISPIHPSQTTPAVHQAVQSDSKWIIGHLDVDQSNSNSNGLSLTFSHQHRTALSHGDHHSSRSKSNTDQSAGILHSFCTSSSSWVCSMLIMSSSS